MPTPSLIFQKFDGPDLASALAEKLAVAGIDYVLENEARWSIRSCAQVFPPRPLE